MPWSKGAHMTMRVVESPVDWMQPGDEYLRGDVATWLDDGDLPVGLVLYATVPWKVVEKDGVLLLYRKGTHRPLMTGMDLRKYRRGQTRYRVLGAIQHAIESTGSPPTRRELAAELRCGTSLVQYHIEILTADGLLDREPGAFRSEWLTQAGEEVLR